MRTVEMHGRVGVRLSDGIKDETKALIRLVKETGLTPSEVVRRALRIATPDGVLNAYRTPKE